jgi:hypothetical protein
VTRTGSLGRASDRQRTVLTGDAERRNKVAAALDGRWLAAFSRGDALVQVWDAATRQRRTVLEISKGEWW